jgi:hemoglobin
LITGNPLVTRKWVLDLCGEHVEASLMGTLYEAVGGHQAVLRLVDAWHERVMQDEVVSHAFSHGFDPHHTERLAAYLSEALGGPTMFSLAYGTEADVVRLHSGMGVHAEMDRRAVACFDAALDDIGVGPDSELGRTLHDYFDWATTTTMARYPESAGDVPGDLTIPRWTWDGLASADTQ